MEIVEGIVKENTADFVSNVLNNIRVKAVRDPIEKDKYIIIKPVKDLNKFLKKLYKSKETDYRSYKNFKREWKNGRAKKDGMVLLIPRENLLKV